MSTESVTRIHPVWPKWTFGDRLRKARHAAGITQREMADQLDVGQPAYGQWEAGNNAPRNIVRVAQDVEALTGVPAAWLLGLTDGPDDGAALPHLDSNQEPFDYRSDLLELGTRHEADHRAA